MEKFCFTAPALPHVFATLENYIACILQIERSATSRADLLKLGNEANAVRGEASFGIELCVVDCPFLVYKKGERPAPKAKETGSRKRKLSSSMMPIAKKKRNASKSSGGGEKVRIRGADIKKVKYR